MVGDSSLNNLYIPFSFRLEACIKSALENAVVSYGLGPGLARLARGNDSIVDDSERDLAYASVSFGAGGLDSPASANLSMDVTE